MQFFNALYNDSGFVLLIDLCWINVCTTITLNDFKVIFVLLCHWGGGEGVWGLGLSHGACLARRVWPGNAKSETTQRKCIYVIPFISRSEHCTHDSRQRQMALGVCAMHTICYQGDYELCIKNGLKCIIIIQCIIYVISVMTRSYQIPNDEL